MAKARIVTNNPSVCLTLNHEEACFLRTLLGKHIIGEGANRALSASIHHALAACVPEQPALNCFTDSSAVGYPALYMLKGK